jgi:hypothetical protein
VPEKLDFRFAEATKDGEQAAWRYVLARGQQPKS